MSLEQWAQIGTLTVAVMAFFISIWGIYLQNKYSRASVTPHLIRNIKLDKVNKQIEISIKNAGLGPAFLKKIIFSINDKSQPECFNLLKYAEDVIKENKLFDKIIYAISDINPGLVIKEGDVLSVVKVNYKLCEASQEEKLMALIDAVGYEVEYESAFGERKFFNG